MRKIACWTLFYLSLLSSFSLSAQSSYDYPYSKIAKDTLGRHLILLTEDLRSINSEVLPHDVKTLRKKIGALKFYFDFFSYAYPHDGGSEDRFLSFRKFLDEGYEVFGNFKDLFDFLKISKEEASKDHYDFADLKKHRKKIFDWIEIYFKEMRVSRGFQEFIQKPLEGEIWERKKSDLSRFIWGSYEGTPKVKVENFNLILKNLLVYFVDTAKERYEKAIKIEDILNYHAQEEFHDFRKQLRYVIKMEKLFPGFYDEDILKSDSFLFFQELVDKYGKLNDDMTKVHYIMKVMSEGHTVYGHNKETLAEIESLWEKIKLGWEEIKVWQSEESVCVLFEKLAFQIDLIGIQWPE